MGDRGIFHTGEVLRSVLPEKCIQKGAGGILRDPLKEAEEACPVFAIDISGDDCCCNDCCCGDDCCCDDDCCCEEDCSCDNECSCGCQD